MHPNENMMEMRDVKNVPPFWPTDPASALCLVQQDFESEMSDMPYYNLVRLDYPALTAELAALPAPSMSVARVFGIDVESSKALMSLGFHKMCVQTLFATGLTRRQPDHAPSPVIDLDLDADTLVLHARNLRFSNFTFDPCLSDASWIRIHRRIIERRLAAPSALKFSLESGFVCFRVLEGKAVIDLFSVLEPRRGIGAALMNLVLDYCATQGLQWVEVVTGCENLPACLFYQKMGFLLFGSIGVFHHHKEKNCNPSNLCNIPDRGRDKKQTQTMPS